MALFCLWVVWTGHSWNQLQTESSVYNLENLLFCPGAPEEGLLCILLLLHFLKGCFFLYLLNRLTGCFQNLINTMSIKKPRMTNTRVLIIYFNQYVSIKLFLCLTTNRTFTIEDFCCILSCFLWETAKLFDLTCNGNGRRSWCGWKINFLRFSIFCERLWLA